MTVTKSPPRHQCGCTLCALVNPTQTEHSKVLYTYHSAGREIYTIRDDSRPLSKGTAARYLIFPNTHIRTADVVNGTRVDVLDALRDAKEGFLAQEHPVLVPAMWKPRGQSSWVHARYYLGRRDRLFGSVEKTQDQTEEHLCMHVVIDAGRWRLRRMGVGWKSESWVKRHVIERRHALGLVGSS